MWPKRSISLLSLLLIAITTLQTQNADAANILGLFTSHSPSHLIVYMSVAKALAEKGHNVTVVSALEPKVTHPSIRTLVFPPAAEQEQMLNNIMTEMAGKKNTFVTSMRNLFSQLDITIEMQANILREKRFAALYESKFDLVIMGYLMNDFQLGVAAKFKCPIIVGWPGPPMDITGGYVGNPSSVAGIEVNFLKRARNLFVKTVMQMVKHIFECRMQKIYTELFSSGKKFPTYSDMKKNVSLVFYTSHFSDGVIRANVPAIVEIGGIQIKEKPAPLPKDIADFLDASKQNGAILFSLGSNLKGSNIRPEIVDIIFKVLSGLKQNVIWKWENLEKIPGKAANILYKKWLPQDDILAHPNLKLFITHAGKGGLAEAQYHAVPMVALPVFADQHTNAAIMAEAGYGLELDMLQITEEKLKKAVKEVLSNPVYAANVKKFSLLYRDRPLTAKENIVFWTEYVLRNHGATHMQSPLVHMHFIQSMNLDVLVLLCVVVYLFYRVTKFALKFVCKKICNKFVGKACNPKKSTSNKNKLKKQ